MSFTQSRGAGLFRLACALVAFAAIAPLRAQTRDFSILYHERARGLAVIEGKGLPQALRGVPPSGLALSFAAFGRSFDIDLRRNDRLTSGLDPQVLAGLGRIDVYAGEVRGVPRSWVRLTRYRGEWSGMIFDGADLYVMEAYSDAAPYLAGRHDAAANGPVIYRWKDAAGPLVDEVTPTVTAVSAGTKSAQAVSAAALQTPLLPSGEEIDIGLVGDSVFGQQNSTGAGSEAAMISMANVADGIFLAQVGVHLNVTQIESLTAATDPFDATDPSTLLSQLSVHRAATPALRGEGLVHLFTGREFPGTSVVGIANLASICDADRAVSLTKVNELGYGALIAAHEIGHNFGAPHDGEAGPCESVTGSYLMSPAVNGSQEFSTCSLEQMAPVIAGASCLYALPSTNVSISGVTAPAQVLLNDGFEVELAVDNHGADAYVVSVDATGDGATVNFVSYEHCTYADWPGCVVRVLGNDQSMPVVVTAGATRIGPASIDVNVRAINDSNAVDNSYHVDFEVLPTVDLAIDRVTATPTFPRPHGTVDVVVDFSNRGAVPATQVAAHLRFVPYQFNVLSIAGPAGPCMESAPGTGDFACPVGAFAPGASGRMTAELEDATGLLGYRSVSASLESAERDLDGSAGSASVNVQPSVADLSVAMDSPAFHDGATMGDRVQIAIRVHNAGPDPAANVALEFVNRDDGYLVVDDIDANGASCAPGEPGVTVCMLGTVAAGADFSIAFAGTAQRTGTETIGVDVFGDTFETGPSDNTQYLNLVVLAAPPASPPPSTPPPSTPPPAPSSSGGGGGGAIDWLSAALLAGSLAWRLVRSRRLNGR